MPLQTLRNCEPKSEIAVGSNLRDLYQELPPFTIDKESGKVVNPTSSIKLVKIGTEDIQEKINSYYDSSCLQSQLSHIAEGSADSSALSAVKGQYLDISEVPTDVDDLIKYLDKVRTDTLAKKAADEAALKKAVDDAAAAQKATFDEAVKKAVAEALANQSKGESK